MNYSFKTISKKVMGDLHTPVSIYLKVRDIYPESALLESSDFHGNENSLSFIALRPLASIGINNGECTATFPDETREVTPLTEDYNVPEAMNAFLGRFKVEGADKKVCGLFGYTAFDAVRYFENIPVMEVHHEENDAPDMLYILYKYILVFNHFKNELTLVEMLQEDEASRLEEIETLIENRNFASYNFQTAGPETSPITGEEYKAMVRQGIKHCLRGVHPPALFQRIGIITVPEKHAGSGINPRSPHVVHQRSSVPFGRQRGIQGIRTRGNHSIHAYLVAHGSQSGKVVYRSTGCTPLITARLGSQPYKPVRRQWLLPGACAKQQARKQSCATTVYPIHT